MKKPRRTEETRSGNAARRKLEFEIIYAQVRKNRDRFIARLQRNLYREGSCLIYRASLDHNGYPRLNFRHEGRHINIHALRVFAILRNCAPIPLGMDVAHTQGCRNRSCVYHTELQHFSKNAVTNRRIGIPF